MANAMWLNVFPCSKVESLAAPSSDHYPILLVRDPKGNVQRIQRQFKFENTWLVEPEFDLLDEIADIIKDK